MGCMKVMKFVLVAFNFLVLVVAGVAIGLGVWALTSEYGAEDMEAITGSDLYHAGCIVVIVGGSVVALISFLGCCGAWTGNRCMLGLYFVIMLIFLILFVVAGALIFFYRDDLRDELEKEMENSLEDKYHLDQDVKNVWDKVQMELKCCGVDGSLGGAKSWYIWQSSQWYINVNQGVNADDRKYVPKSCCNTGSGANSFTFEQCQGKNPVPTEPPQTDYMSVTAKNPALFTDGCLNKLEDEIDEYIVAIGVIAVIAFVIMFFCVVFSVCVCMDASRKEQMV